MAAAALLLLLCSAAASLLLALPVTVAAESLSHYPARIARRFWIIVSLLPPVAGVLFTAAAFAFLLGDITATPHQERLRPHLCLERFTSLPDAPFRSQLYAVVALALVLYALVRFSLSLRASRRAEAIAAAALGTMEPASEIAVLPIPGEDPECFSLGIKHAVTVVTQGLYDLLTPEEVAAVLAHEQCHVRQQDNRLELLLRLVTDPLIWVPSTHYYRHALRAAIEQTCDASAAEATSTAALVSALGKMEAAQQARQVKLQGDLASLRPLFPSHANPAARLVALSGERYASLAPSLSVMVAIEFVVLGAALLWFRRPIHDTLYCTAHSLLQVLHSGF